MSVSNRGSIEDSLDSRDDRSPNVILGITPGENQDTHAGNKWLNKTSSSSFEECSSVNLKTRAASRVQESSDQHGTCNVSTNTKYVDDDLKIKNIVSPEFENDDVEEFSSSIDRISTSNLGVPITTMSVESHDSDQSTDFMLMRNNSSGKRLAGNDQSDEHKDNSNHILIIVGILTRLATEIRNKRTAPQRKNFCKVSQDLESNSRTTVSQEGFTCSVCGATYTRVCLLRRHQLKEHRLGGKPYYCHLCAIAFRYYSKYRNHFCASQNQEQEGATHIQDQEGATHIQDQEAQSKNINNRNGNPVTSGEEDPDLKEGVIMSESTAICDYPAPMLTKRSRRSVRLMEEPKRHRPSQETEAEPQSTHKVTDKTLRQTRQVTSQQPQSTQEGGSDLNGRKVTDKTLRQTRQVKCPYCEENVTTEKRLNAHIIKWHPDKSYKCQVCRMNFVRENYYKAHMKRHTGVNMFKCSIEGCGKTFPAGAQLNNHIKASHNRFFTCHLCSNSYGTKQRLQRHIQNQHTPKSERKHPCQDCDERFNEVFLLREHVTHHHGPKKSLMCDQCGKSFTSVRGLRKHKMLHNPNTTFRCPHCKKIFAHKENLDSHIVSKHSGPPEQVPCDTCGKTFSSKETCRVHILQNHVTEKPYVCKHCGEGFARRSFLNVHERRHIPVADLKSAVSCDECTMKFRNKSALLNHKVARHSNERPFTCGFCDKTFKTKVALGQHTKVEHWKIGFMCKICSKVFPNRGKLVRHERSHQGEEVSKDQSDQSEKVPGIMTHNVRMPEENHASSNHPIQASAVNQEELPPRGALPQRGALSQRGALPQREDRMIDSSLHAVSTHPPLYMHPPTPDQAPYMPPYHSYPSTQHLTPDVRLPFNKHYQFSNY